MICVLTRVLKSLFCVVLLTPMVASEMNKTKSSFFSRPSTHQGTHSFDQLVTSNLYVDKTEMIKEFLESINCQVTVITRPRKWGKTVNLEMFKRFFEIEVNDIGIQLKIRQRKNQIIFKGGEVTLADGSSKVLKQLKIANCSSSMNLLGMFPVIMLQLSRVKGKNYKAIEIKLSNELRNAFGDHSYLKQYLRNENQMLNTTEKALLGKYFSTKRLSINELENGLIYFSKILFEHFRRKVIVLIDEKDAPLNHAVENFGDKDSETQHVLNLQQNLFKGLINNIYIERCLITGTLPFTEDVLFINASKICVRSVLDSDYSDMFGFSEIEVDEVSKAVNLTHAQVDKMKYWYKGFYHGDKMLYNPLDIMGYFTNLGKLLDYWADSGRVKLLDEFLVTDEAQEDLQKLLQDEGTVKTMSNYDKSESKEEGFHLFFGIFYRLLVHHGYLNAFKLNETSNTYLLRIPNQEIRNFFVDFKMQWFCSKHNILTNDLLEIVGCLVTKQMDHFKESLTKVFDSFRNETLEVENDYHGIMSEILGRLLNHNMVFSSKHFELGKCYHLVIARSHYQGHTAFVLEYSILYPAEDEKADITRNLQSLAQGTLENIDSKIYGPVLIQYKYINEVVTVGIAFFRTNLELAYKVFKQRR